MGEIPIQFPLTFIQILCVYSGSVPGVLESTHDELTSEPIRSDTEPAFGRHGSIPNSHPPATIPNRIKSNFTCCLHICGNILQLFGLKRTIFEPSYDLVNLKRQSFLSLKNDIMIFKLATFAIQEIYKWVYKDTHLVSYQGHQREAGQIFYNFP